MVTLIAEHWIKPEAGEKALLEPFTKNTERLKKSKGFVSRQVIRSLSDPSKITTVTTWKTKEDYLAFMQELERGRLQRDPNAPRMILAEKLEGYDVLSSA